MDSEHNCVDENMILQLPCEIQNTPYTMEVLPLLRASEAMSVLTAAWVGLEPLAMWTKISYHSLHGIFMSIQKKALSTAPMLSIVITDIQGKIVGVSLNREFSLEYKGSCTNPIESLLNELENVYREYHASQKRPGKVFYIDSIGVVDEAKGKGLATFLILGSLCYAYKLGYKTCVIETTNIYSERICAKLGMKRIAEIKYDDYEHLLPDGTKSHVFKGMDKMFTEILTSKRGNSSKPITHAASRCILHEANIGEVLAASFTLVSGSLHSNGTTKKTTTGKMAF